MWLLAVAYGQSLARTTYSGLYFLFSVMRRSFYTLIHVGLQNNKNKSGSLDGSSKLRIGYTAHRLATRVAELKGSMGVTPSPCWSMNIRAATRKNCNVWKRKVVEQFTFFVSAIRDLGYSFHTITSWSWSRFLLRFLAIIAWKMTNAP